MDRNGPVDLRESNAQTQEKKKQTDGYQWKKVGGDESPLAYRKSSRGPTVQHQGLCSNLSNNLYGKKSLK